MVLWTLVLTVPVWMCSGCLQNTWSTVFRTGLLITCETGRTGRVRECCGELWCLGGVPSSNRCGKSLPHSVQSHHRYQSLLSDWNSAHPKNTPDKASESPSLLDNFCLSVCITQWSVLTSLLGWSAKSIVTSLEWDMDDKSTPSSFNRRLTGLFCVCFSVSYAIDVNGDLPNIILYSLNSHLSANFRLPCSPRFARRTLSPRVKGDTFTFWL